MHILMIEDDKALCDAISFELKNYGYHIESCYDGEEGLMFGEENIYDLIILDRMLPSIDGLQIIRTLRQKGIKTPVIMVTALSSIGDRVHGLDAGADDYLSKPFATEELLARIRALSRRPTDWNIAKTLTLGDTILDPINLTLSSPSMHCTLSKKETLLFEIFFKQPGQTLTRNLLISRVWGPDSDIEDGNLDNYIHFLRRRLRSIQSNLQLTTVRGMGYALEVPHA